MPKPSTAQVMLWDLIPEPEPEPAPADAYPPDLGRVVYTDRDGREFRAVHLFTLGPLATIRLDEGQHDMPIWRRARVDPSTIRTESGGSDHAQA